MGRSAPRQTWTGPTVHVRTADPRLTTGGRHQRRRPVPPDRSVDLAGDRATVEAVLAGDRDAFRILVDREGAQVVRACHRVLGDLHDAEDAAQEAFVTAYRSLASWRGDGPFGAWLTRIAVRIALRKAGQRRAVTWRDPFGGTDGPVNDPITMAMDQVSLGGGVGHRPVVAGRPRRASDRCPRRRAGAPGTLPGGRDAAVLRRDERSTRSPDRPGDPSGTVKTHLHRGLHPAARDPRRGGRAMTGPGRRFDPAEVRGPGVRRHLGRGTGRDPRDGA